MSVSPIGNRNKGRRTEADDRLPPSSKLVILRTSILWFSVPDEGLVPHLDDFNHSQLGKPFINMGLVRGAEIVYHMVFEIKPRIGLVTFGHRYFKMPYQELRERLQSQLTEYPVDLRVFEKIPISVKETVEAANFFRSNDVDVVLIYVADWPSEEFPVVLARELMEYPFVILGSHRLESEKSFVPFAGITSMTGNFMRVGKHFFPVLGAPAEKRTIDRVFKLAMAAATSKALRRSTVGMFGGINLSQLDTGYSEFHVRKLVPGILHFDNTELLSRFDEIGDGEALTIARDIARKVGTVEVDQKQLVIAARAYLAVKQMIEQHDLDAVTIREWGTEREINEQIFTVELAASLLMDEGKVVIPECDIATTITSLATCMLARGPMFFGELAFADFERNLIALIHTGHPSLSIMKNPKDVKITPAVVEVQDFLGKKEGVSLEGELRDGRITLTKISGRPMEDKLKMVVTGAQIQEGRNPFPGQGFTYAWIRPDCDARQLLDTLIREGFGHHMVIGYGDIREELDALGDILDIKRVII